MEKGRCEGKVLRLFSQEKYQENPTLLGSEKALSSLGKAGLYVHLLLNFRKSTEKLHHVSSRKYLTVNSTEMQIFKKTILIYYL